MPTIQYGSKSIEVPEGLTDEQQLELLNDESEGAKVPSFSNPMPANQPVDHAATKGSSSVDPTTLVEDPKWMEASKVLYKQHHGVDFDGTSQELADYGLNQISYFNYNTAGMAVNAVALKNAKQEEKESFLYLMDQFDHLGYSWGGAGRFIGAAATDPLTYVGLGTLGIGTVAGAAGKTMGKAVIRSAIQASIEAGIQQAAQSTIKQEALVNADRQTEIDYGQVAKDTAIGAAGGAVLGSALGAIGSRFMRTRTGVPQASITEPPRVMEPSLFKKATEGADGARGPSVTLGTKLEGASRFEASTTTVSQSADIARLSSEPMDPAERVFAAVDEIAPTETLGIFPKAREGVTKDARVATELLVNASKKDVEQLVGALVNKATTPEQRMVLDSSFRLATDQLEAKAHTMWARYKTLENDADRIAAFKDLAMVEKMRDNVKAGDTLLSSYQGSGLSQRVGSLNTGEFRGVDEETFLREAGVPPELATPDQKAWAKEEYYSLVEKYIKRAESRDEIKSVTHELEAKVDAYLSGDRAISFDDLKKLRESLQEAKLKAAEVDSSEFGLIKSTSKTHKVLNDVNTAIISTVFSPSTLVYNTIPSLVKTVTKPALNWVAKGPTDEAAMKEMLTFYHTMYNNIDISWQMAKASFELERSLMMTETYANKFIEGAKGTGILENRVGRVIRIFPRLLSATDEFFQSLNYRGFVMGEAHHAAIMDATNAGLSGAEKEAYVTRKLQEAADHMFGHVHHRTDVLEWTIEAGKAKGLKGDKLDAWVKQQLDSRGHLMKEVNSESGARYVEDLLFKRKFSGKGFISDSASKYEQLSNKYPLMKTMGQLFFRTPVRVFEEGMRMTPGLNLITPRFLSDLRGKNGQAAYARAMGEAMVGFSITQWVMTQYAAGNITGGGPTDYKQKRSLEEAGWEAYTIKIGDTKLTYRNYDPMVTPIKIIVNMMERYQDLEYRRTTGEFAKGGGDEKELLAMAGVAAGSVFQALKDANLWEAVNQAMQGLDKASDPEGNGMDTFMSHVLGQKLAYAVPSVVSKLQQVDHPELTDPSSLWQYVAGKFNPSSPSVSHKHDALGNVRLQHDPVGKLFGVQTSTEDMRKEGRSDKEIEVLRELAKLSIAGNTHFVMPVRDKTMMPAIDDLRTVSTKDGSGTLYDRVNTLLKDSSITDDLHNALVGRSDLPVAAKLKAAREIINTHRKTAFMRLWKEHAGLSDDFLKSKLFEVEGKAGYRDSKSLPYLTD